MSEPVVLPSILGINIVPSSALPIYPSDGENARRMVRHGYADVLAWLGEKVGPKPGEPTHALLVGSNLFASTALVGRLTEESTR